MDSIVNPIDSCSSSSINIMLILCRYLKVYSGKGRYFNWNGTVIRYQVLLSVWDPSVYLLDHFCEFVIFVAALQLDHWQLPPGWKSWCSFNGNATLFPAMLVLITVVVHWNSARHVLFIPALTLVPHSAIVIVLFFNGDTGALCSYYSQNKCRDTKYWALPHAGFIPSVF